MRAQLEKIAKTWKEIGKRKEKKEVKEKR